MHDLEQVINYIFLQKNLLNEALTHPSAGTARNTTPSYERLEFLGDRVLGLVVAKWLFDEFPLEPEGMLARRHSNLVCRNALAQIGKHIGLDQHIKLAHGERKSGGQDKASVLSNCCEALIAALYIDGGLNAAETFIKNYWQDFMYTSDTATKDSKSQLQEWAQGRGMNAPQYFVIDQAGSQHSPIFTIEVRIDSLPHTQAQGSNKQEAAQKAAAAMLQNLQSIQTRKE